MGVDVSPMIYIGKWEEGRGIPSVEANIVTGKQIGRAHV